MYKLEIVHDYSDTALHDILIPGRETHPASWQYPNAEDYYGEQLRNKNTIHILLRRDGVPIGYLLAIPHNEAVEDEELRQADLALTNDSERLYIETIEISSQYTQSLIGGKLCLMMLRALHEEAGKRGVVKFSMHVRMTTGLNVVLRKIYGDGLTLFRTIENWPFYNFEEPTEYIEGTYLFKPGKCLAQIRTLA